MKRLALLVAPAAVLVLAGTALGHSAGSPSCGQAEFHSSTGWTVELFTAGPVPPPITFGPFAHDGLEGPYPVPAGTYGFLFRTADRVPKESGTLVVAACPATPLPSRVPAPSPSSSSPAASGPAGSPPAPSGPAGHHSPIPTPPSTSTGSVEQAGQTGLLFVPGVLFVAAGILGAVQVRRRRR